jgi:hypothetical protein
MRVITMSFGCIAESVVVCATENKMDRYIQCARGQLNIQFISSRCVVVSFHLVALFVYIHP